MTGILSETEGHFRPLGNYSVNSYEASRSLQDVAPGTVEQTLADIRQRYSKIDLHVRGECRAAGYKEKHWSFDLVTARDDKIYVLQAKIWENNIPLLRARFQRHGTSLESAMTDGMHLTVKGQSRSWPETGEWYLDIKDIEPVFTRTGSLHLRDQKTLENLISSYPGHARLKIRRAELHRPVNDAFEGHQLKRVMVIAPENSQGSRDLQHHLRNSWRTHRPQVIERTMSWSSSGSADIFRKHAQEAHQKECDLIVIVRGGGSWRFMRGFEDEHLARAILDSKVPVVTGVGHAKDVSIADRAATASLATPASVGMALTTHMGKQKKAEWKARQPKAIAAPARAAASLADYDRELAAARQAVRAANQTIKATETELRTTRKELSASKQEVHHWKSRAWPLRRRHTQDLLDLATRRVRAYSGLASTLTILTTAALIALHETVLSVLSLDQTPLSVILYIAGVSGASILCLRGQHRARQQVGTVSDRRMRKPPESPEAWDQMVKDVRTIRRLRQLLLLRPE